MARELLKMAVDENVSNSVKLAAIRYALDHGGVGAKTEVDISVSAKPFEQILVNMEAGPRSEFRRSLGIGRGCEASESEEPPPALAQLDGYGDDDLIVDGEIVDADDEDELVLNEPTSTPQEWESDDQDRPSAVFGGPLGPSGPAGSGIMSLEDAVQAQARCDVTHGSCRSGGHCREIDPK